MAKLFDADSDISQRWFVYYFFKDPETGKYIRFRQWISSRLLTRAQRYNKARDLQLQNRHSSLDETQRYLDRFSRVASERFLNSFPRL